MCEVSFGEFVAANKDEEETMSCPICQIIMEEPTLVSCCGQTFCNNCIQGWVLSKKECPLCRASITTQNLVKNRMLEKIILNIKGKCDSCTWNGTYEGYLKHNCNGNVKEKPAKVLEIYNSDGVKVWKGNEGRHYCGRTGLYSCDKCNGVCGPTNGCNCPACRKLDEEQGLNPVHPWSVEAGIVTPLHLQHRLKFYSSPKFYWLGRYKCDNCKVSLTGPVYHCDVCKDFDLCPSCSNHQHNGIYYQQAPYSSGYYRCDRCNVTKSGPVYHCNGCGNYDECPNCNTQGPQYRPHGGISSTFHPQHKLQYYSKPIYYPGQSYSCNQCHIQSFGPVYHCNICKTYDLCPSCSNHQHQTVYFSQPPYSTKSFKCDLCAVSKSGPVYHCKGCGNYDECPDCKSNSMQPISYKPFGGISSQFHPQHKLQYYSKPKFYPGNTFICNQCHIQSSGPAYHCDTCKNYDLCPSCSNHQHQPVYFPQSPYPSGSYKCDLCAVSKSGPVYHCKGCGNYDECLNCNCHSPHQSSTSSTR